MSHILRTMPIQLSESQEGKVKELQILKTGNFKTPKYGSFVITTEMLSDMVKNFSDGVRGIVPALDYAHDSEGVAAGWFKKLFTKNDGQELWALVEMTPKGEKTLSDKEYAYISADFDQSYETNETPIRKLGCVLLGAALTNRPVIKNMKGAVQLSEEKESEMDKDLEKKMMAMEKQLEELYKLADVESFDGLKKKLGEMNKEVKELEESEKEKKELSESLGKTSSKLEAHEKTIKELTEKNVKLEKEVSFSTLLSEGKACMAQKEAFMSGDMIEFAKKSSELNLSEKGHGKSGKSDKSPEDKIMLLAEEKMKERDTLTLSEAISEARKENPELVKLLK